MLHTYKEQSNGDLAGKIFERLILYLCENSSDLKNILLQYYCLAEEEFTIEYVKITDKDDLGRKMMNIMDYLNKNKIPLFDLSYNPNFPDIDFILCFIGVQITVGLTHTLSAEIIDMLNGWKNEIYLKYQTSLTDSMKQIFNSDLRFLVISNHRNVDLFYRKVDEENKFPEALLQFKVEKTEGKENDDRKRVAEINYEKENDDRKRVAEINYEKDMMYISYKFLEDMIYTELNKEHEKTGR